MKLRNLIYLIVVVSIFRPFICYGQNCEGPCKDSVLKIKEIHKKLNLDIEYIRIICVIRGANDPIQCLNQFYTDLHKEILDCLTDDVKKQFPELDYLINGFENNIIKATDTDALSWEALPPIRKLLIYTFNTKISELDAIIKLRAELLAFTTILIEMFDGMTWPEILHYQQEAVIPNCPVQ